MKIRVATMEDYNALCHLFAQGDKYHVDLVPDVFQEFPGPARSRDFLKRFQDNESADIIVAELEGKIIGFISLEKSDYPPYPLFRRRPYVMIHSLVIEESHRRMGIGSLLLQAAKEWAKDRGIRHLQATVWDANKTALTFYSKHGFIALNQKIELDIDV